MYKLLAMGLNQVLRNWLIVMITTVIIMIVDINSTSAIAASIWDQEIVSHGITREVTVYRSPACSCCGNWLEHIQKHGFKIKADIKTEDIEAIKQKYNLPKALASCHTAIIDGYVMEGHIPAEDIKLFLKQQPQLTGLAVPGMTIGTPGMESGNTKQPFTVMEFDHKGEFKVFKNYQSY